MNDLVRRALLKGVSAFAATLLVGAAVVYASGRLGGDPTVAAGSTPGGSPSPDAVPPSVTPEAFLAWLPGGLPSEFGERLSSLPFVRDAAVATAGVTWMTRSLDAAGDPVDEPPAPYSIPIDTTGVDVSTFAPFLPKGPQRAFVARLGAGESLLSETAATLRGLGEGATLEFAVGPDLTVAGVLPDVLMGGYELLVPRGTGELLGVSSDAYAVFRARAAEEPTIEDVQDELRPLVPASARFPAVEVRAPGTTSYLRANDAVPPPASYKERFGEFSALIDTTENHDLDLETRWVEAHIETRTIPVFGSVQCAPKVVFFLKQAAASLASEGATDAVTEVGDCFADTWITGNPEGALTPHLWGAAIDVNGFANPPGEQPDLDDRIVEAMQSAGFAWGGDAEWPQGDHFVFVGASNSS